MKIAVVLPHPWPPSDDVGWHVEAEAAALARRGHSVTILAPTRDRSLLAEGRAVVHALTEGGAPAGTALAAPPGEVRVVAVGRALTSQGRRAVTTPIDMAGALEDVLGHVPFDVVHVHEPLAPSPALAALRHAPGITAATFHGHAQLAGVAFLQPLVDRALSRVDVCLATSDIARRTLAELLPRDYVLCPGGVDPALVRPPPVAAGEAPGLVIVARERDRAGLRFALSTLRGTDLEAIGSVTVIGPPDAPWRTRAAVPKALREGVAVVPDAGPASRASALAEGGIALLATPEDVSGPVVAEAMAAGLAVIAPRCEGVDLWISHGRDGLILPPFATAAWTEAVSALATDAPRRARLSAAARARARDWDEVAAELEGHLERARAARGSGPRTERPRGRARALFADLRVRMGPTLDPAKLVAACRERRVNAVGVAAPAGVAMAAAVAQIAPEDLMVIPGQEIRTDDGIIVGLFLERDVPDGLPLAAAAAAVRAQSGLVLLPHPAVDGVASPAALRDAPGSVDLYEVLTVSAPGPGARATRMIEGFGLIAVAGSGAVTPDEVGAVGVRLGAFSDSQSLRHALAGARLVRRPRALFARPQSPPRDVPGD